MGSPGVHWLPDPITPSLMGQKIGIYALGHPPLGDIESHDVKPARCTAVFDLRGSARKIAGVCRCHLLDVPQQKGPAVQRGGIVPGTDRRKVVRKSHGTRFGN